MGVEDERDESGEGEGQMPPIRFISSRRVGLTCVDPLPSKVINRKAPLANLPYSGK